MRGWVTTQAARVREGEKDRVREALEHGAITVIRNMLWDEARQLATRETRVTPRTPSVPSFVLHDSQKWTAARPRTPTPWSTRDTDAMRGGGTRPICTTGVLVV